MKEHKQSVSKSNEKRTLIIIIVTLLTMIAEIAYGYITNSMALLADGYHMATHALALGLAYLAYVLERKFENSEKFANGTGKIGILAAYTSSIFLGLTGFWIIFEAFSRFLNPEEIIFNEAILIALIGLIVNSICIFIMEHKNSHHCHHSHEDEHSDYNFMAAYYHILADALTSVLAIVALLAGKYFGLIVLDPVIGIVGGILILSWAKNLITNSIKILVDYNR